MARDQDLIELKEEMVRMKTSLETYIKNFESYTLHKYTTSLDTVLRNALKEDLKLKELTNIKRWLIGIFIMGLVLMILLTPDG